MMTICIMMESVLNIGRMDLHMERLLDAGQAWRFLHPVIPQVSKFYTCNIFTRAAMQDRKPKAKISIVDRSHKVEDPLQILPKSHRAVSIPIASGLSRTELPSALMHDRHELSRVLVFNTILILMADMSVSKGAVFGDGDALPL